MNIRRFVAAASLIGLASVPLVASAQPVALAKGSFVSAAHTTTGTATIYRLNNGSRILRLTNFSTSNGPKVHVLLTEHVVHGKNVVDASSIDLGDLKGTNGNQNYPIPAAVQLRHVKAAAIYCERFHVMFGSATLH